MSTPFAAINTRIATAVARHLADAEADFGGGVIVSGLFREPYAEAFGGMVGGNSPSFEATTPELASVVVGATLTIGSQPYVVAAVHPDGAGMTQLILDAV